MRSSLPLFLASALLWQPASPAPADTHSLLVGISRYSDSTPLRAQGISAPNLPAAENDVDLLRRLLDRLSPQGQFTVLLNERATYDNVVEALLQLRDAARADDAVVVYFTLHGASIYEGGKLKARALLLWDQELPGRALRYRFGQLRARDKTLIVDSCFAAGADKGIRGAGEPLAKSIVVHREPTADEPDVDFLPLPEVAAPGEKGFGGDRPYTVLAACPESVPAYAAPFAAGGAATRWLSAFTLGLYRSLFLGGVAPDRLETQLRDTTNALLAPLKVSQQPVALGRRPAADSLFGGTQRASLPAARTEGGRWAIPVGLAADIGPGSVFRVVDNRDVLLEVAGAEWFSCTATVTRGRLAGPRAAIQFVSGRLPPPQPTGGARKDREPREGEAPAGPAVGSAGASPSLAERLRQLPRSDAVEVAWSRPAYRLGEPLTFAVTPKRPGYLSLLVVCGGKSQFLLPTLQHPAPRVGAEEIVTDATLGLRLMATPPAGLLTLLAVLTDAKPDWPVSAPEANPPTEPLRTARVAAAETSVTE
jgi:hypothetical protein